MLRRDQAPPPEKLVRDVLATLAKASHELLLRQGRASDGPAAVREPVPPLSWDDLETMARKIAAINEQICRFAERKAHVDTPEVSLERRRAWSARIVDRFSPHLLLAA